MTDVEAYRATLARLESDQAKADAISEKRRAAISAIRDLLAASNGVLAPSTASDQSNAPKVPRGYTMKQAAVWALEQTGHALRVRQIYEIMMAGGYKYDGDYERFRGSMTPTLDRQSDTFKKVGMGLYDLVDKHTETDETQPAEVGLGL
jgi:hypothetical protein